MRSTGYKNVHYSPRGRVPQVFRWPCDLAPKQLPDNMAISYLRSANSASSLVLITQTRYCLISVELIYAYNVLCSNNGDTVVGNTFTGRPLWIKFQYSGRLKFTTTIVMEERRTATLSTPCDDE